MGLRNRPTLRTLEGHASSVNDVAITLDGRRVVSASADQTLRLWDLKSGKEIAAFTGDGSMVSCAVAPDGRMIVAGEGSDVPRAGSGQVHVLRLVEADKTKPSIGDTKIQLMHSKKQATDS